MVIDGFGWFVAAVVVCGAHALYLRSWAADRRAHRAWFEAHDKRSAAQHAEFMAAIKR